jgi:HEAT repeat protein
MPGFRLAPRVASWTGNLCAASLSAIVCITVAARSIQGQAAQQPVATPTADAKLTTIQEPASKKLMKPITLGPAINLTPAVAATPRIVEILDLERAVNQAELIMAARLVDVSETRIVHGGRNEEVTQQYRFEPVRILKGIYARDSLLMTGQDLGIYRFAATGDRLERGQLMLVLLARQGQGYLNCATDGDTLGQSIPRLDSIDDPLLASISVLIATSRTRDRAARVAMLRDGLKVASGRAASPLLLAIGRRPLLAARSSGMIDAVTPQLASKSDGLRAIAASTLDALLEADPSASFETRTKAAGALATSLASLQNLKARVATIRALGATRDAAVKDQASATWLQTERMNVQLAEPTWSLAEQAAKLRALSQIDPAGWTDAIVVAYSTVPLDAPDDLQAAANWALSRIGDRARASECITLRMRSKVATGLGIAAEIEVCGHLPVEVATPLLLKAATYPLGRIEQHAFAQACLTIHDPRLVASLGPMLDPSDWNLRQTAIAALERIGTEEAASTLWPHLGEEVYVNGKLHLIAFLGRHGFRDGYAQAIEYLAQPGAVDDAVEALAALNDPRALPELWRIWRTSNDSAWNAAALRALARLGQAELAPKLLELARTPSDPLAPAALIGLGDLGVAEALPIARTSLASRSDALTIAAIRASTRLLKRPELRDEAIRDRLAALLADSNASQEVRTTALDALVELKDPRLPASLDAAARDAGLEGTPLLARVEAALAR